ncbi:MAG: phenylpyruvate tautomerase MIF-related protein [Prochlorococcus sp.]
MPLINVRTSLASVDDADGLLKQLSKTLANETGKPETYVMTLLELGVPMTFAGSSEACAYVEIKSIGALKPKAMSAVFTALIEEWLGIPGNRIYLSFEDVDAGAWGWNGRTFGG